MSKQGRKDGVRSGIQDEQGNLQISVLSWSDLKGLKSQVELFQSISISREMQAGIKVQSDREAEAFYPVTMPLPLFIFVHPSILREIGQLGPSSIRRED